MSIYLGTNKVGANTNFIPSGLLGYMGPNAKLIAHKTHSFKLSDTNFSSITPTTSTQSLTLPATTYTTSPATTIICHRLGSAYDGTVIDKDNHTYYIYFYFNYDYSYTQDMTGSIRGIKTAVESFIYNYSYKGISSTGGQSTSGSSSTNGVNVATLNYAKADNSYTSTTSYGVYIGSYSNVATINSNNIELKLASLYVRCSASYFPVASMQLVDPSKITFNFSWDVYEADSSWYQILYRNAYEKIVITP